MSEWSCSVVSDSAIPWTVAYQLLRPWNFPGKSTGVGCHFLLQGIFVTQESNPGLLHCRQTLYLLSHQGSPCFSKDHFFFPFGWDFQGPWGMSKNCLSFPELTFQAKFKPTWRMSEPYPLREQGLLPSPAPRKMLLPLPRMPFPSGCNQKKVKSVSHAQFFAGPWTVAYQAPPSMGFSRQEYWNGLPFPSPGDFPNPGIKPGSPALQTDALPTEPPGKPQAS